MELKNTNNEHPLLKEKINWEIPECYYIWPSDRVKILLEKSISLNIDQAGFTEKATPEDKINWLKEEIGITDVEIKALDISL